MIRTHSITEGGDPKRKDKLVKQSTETRKEKKKKKETYPEVRLVVRSPVNTIPILELLSQSTISLFPFRLDNGLLLRFRDTNHA